MSLIKVFIRDCFIIRVCWWMLNVIIWLFSLFLYIRFLRTLLGLWYNMALFGCHTILWGTLLYKHITTTKDAVQLTSPKNFCLILGSFKDHLLWVWRCISFNLSWQWRLWDCLRNLIELIIVVWSSHWQVFYILLILDAISYQNIKALRLH